MREGGHGWRSRRVLAAGVVAVLVIAAVLVALGPPAFLGLGNDERPSPRAGDPVPPVRTRPAARIAVAGDTGTGDAAQRTTVLQMVRQGRSEPYDGLVLLGDLIYEDGDADLARSRILEPFAPLVDAGAELVPALGNHDYESGEQRQILEVLDRERSWYAEWVGPVRLLVLDSNRVEADAQTEWLRRALAAPVPPGTWTFVALHHPPYSAGHHGSDTTVRDRWSELFAAAGVPLVLAGHDHDYQRSTPQDGVTYVVSGAGAKLRATGHEDFTAVSAARRHFLDLLVYRDRVVGRAIDHAGRLVDAFTLNRVADSG